MTDESKTQKPKIESLELNRETLQDLTEGEAEQAQGGLMAGPSGRVSCESCKTACDACD